MKKRTSVFETKSIFLPLPEPNNSFVRVVWLQKWYEGWGGRVLGVSPNLITLFRECLTPRVV